MTHATTLGQLTAQEAEATREKRILFRRAVAMRDGIELCTDVYLPPDTGRRPTVVVRTPYGRHMQILMRLAKRLNQCGCAVVLQDCRGRYQSEGVFDLDLEEPDGQDTLAWAGRQDWCDGTVGLYGASIAAHPNYLVAASPMPEGMEVKAIVSVMGSVSHHAMIYPGGALLLHWALPWAMMMDRSDAGMKHWNELPWKDVFKHLPLAGTPGAYQVDSPFWPDLVSHPARRHWAKFDAVPRLGTLNVPTLHLTGWQDFMLGESLTAYREMSRGEAPQKLVVGPWDHRTVFTSLFSKTDAMPNQFALVELIALWFQRWLVKDRDPLANSDPEAEGAREFLVEENGAVLCVEEDGRWLETDGLPLSQDLTDHQTWYLHSQSHANTAAGDGVLSLEKPSGLGRDVFTYDPEDPVPTQGGCVWPFPQGGLMPGGADQSEVEERPDVLVYTGPKLKKDLYVVGPVEVDLWAASSAQDTDFTAKLVDVDRFGVPRIVQDAIVRGRFVQSLDQEEPLAPHQPHLYRISLHSLARKFKKGHRLRIEISSSNFPKYDRNLNVAGPLHTQIRGMPAEQTIFHGGAVASCLRIQTVDPGALNDLELSRASSAANGAP